MARLFLNYFGAFLALRDVGEFNDRRAHVDYERCRDPLGMTLQMCDLNAFDYKAYRATLNNINLNISAGEMVAVVGPTEGGKMALARAILGLATHITGSILINGKDRQEYTVSSLREHMTGCFQKVGKCYGSLRKNIALGNIEHIDDDSKIQEAIDLTSLAWPLNDLSLDQDLCIKEQRHNPDNQEIISKCPCGRKHLTEKEWKRLALVRALMRAGKADLMVFEQPCELDTPEEEETLLRRLYDLTHTDGFRSTTVFVSHQYRNVYSADRIVYIAEGVSLQGMN